MPGPGHKKSKVKARNEASHLQVAKVSGNVDGRDATLVATRELDASMDPSIISLVKDVNNVEDWKICSDILCDFLEIPDLSTRNGLKQIHKNFDEYYRRLQRTYRMGADNDKVAGGIVGIYAKMCADSLLRDKLFKDANLLSDIVALLSRQNCCHVALQALCSITHHGHRETRMEIAKKTPALLKVLEEHPDDPKISHLLIVTLSHTASAVVSIDTPDPKLLKLVNMPKLVRVMVAHVRRPNASPELIDHALSFLSGATLYCSDIFFAYPTAIDLLVACARSRDLQTRVMGAFGIMRLHVAHHEKDDVSLDHSKLMEVARKRMPDHLTDAIMDRGTFGEMFLTLSASQDFQRAMMRVVKDRDLYQLGLTLAELVLRTEFSVADGAFQFQNPRTGKLENSDVGLPFVRWLDALPLCANAIRKKGIKGEEDLADIIELKFLIKQSRMDEAHAIARKSIQRNPHIGFYYYVLTLGAPKAIGLRWAKKGLMCPNLTDYVRNALHYRAAEHATELGLYMLYESGEGDENWEQGLAFIMSALEDAKAFMDCAAPDCRSMTSVIQLYTLVSFVVKGHEIGSDLKGLKDANDLLKIADELTLYFGRTLPRTQMRQVRDTLINRTPAAASEWDEHVARFSARTSVSDIATDKAEADLAAWLDTMHLENGEAVRLVHGNDNKPRPTVNPSKVALYMCSWCKNPSAALKKCSGCEIARYCDTSCQKDHWTRGHKKTCKRSTAT